MENMNPFQQLNEAIVKETIQRETTLSEEAFFLAETTEMRFGMNALLKDMAEKKIPERLVSVVEDSIFYYDEQIKLREKVIQEKIKRRFPDGRC